MDVGANQSMATLHIIVNIQHTFANLFLAMFEVLVNTQDMGGQHQAMTRPIFFW